MKIRELRDLVDGDTVLWIETAEGEYLEAGEADSLSHKYDDYDIGRMLVQRYPSMHTSGITIQI